MDVSGYKKKFKVLFDKLLEPTFEISAYHSENLLKYLDGSRGHSVGKILETPFFTDLIVHALKNFDNVTTSVQVFIVKLLSIGLRNEVHFNRFHQIQGFDKLLEKDRVDMRAISPELHLSYIEQAVAMTAHYSGVKFVMEQKLCARILRPYTHHRTEPLATCIYDVMARLVWKLNEYDEEAMLLEALQTIVQPIISTDYQTAVSIGKDCERTTADQLISYLHTVAAILGDIERLNQLNYVVPILSQFFLIEMKLTTILEETHDAELACLVAEVCLRYYYAASRQAVLRDRSDENRINEELNQAFNKIVRTLVKKRSVATILDFICRCHIFWYKVEQTGQTGTFEKFGRQFHLQNQFLIMILVPIFVKNKAKQRLVNDAELQEAIETFTYGLVAIVPDDIIKAAYSMRDLIHATGVGPACVCSVREVLRLRGHLTKRQAGIVFQTVYYALTDYVLSDGSGDLVLVQNPLRTPEDALLLSATLDAIKMLIEHHEINWYESLEIVNLQAALMNLIKQSILPTKLLIQVIELINVSVRKALSPELALLLQSARGGSLREVGGAARDMLQRTEWEAREAALNLLHSFIEIAYVKFIPLRSVISEHGLVLAAARAALRDPAPRARACALRCLAAATSCECVWKELLIHYRDLYEQLVNILRYNSEGEVRKEAANVLTHVYINHRVTKAFRTYVSRVMAKAAIEDSYWEVQIAALNYWNQVVRNLFTDRGMIDGKFPTVTFSKEKRKIITLDDKEIFKQVEAIMDHLSTSGCLTVLLKCMSPSNHIEVIEKTHNLASKLVAAVDYYKFRVNDRLSIEQKPSTSNEPRVNGDVEMNAIKTSPPDAIKPDQSDIISELFECFDANYLPEDTLNTVEILHPNKFIDLFKSTDYKAIIDSKKESTEPVDLDTLIYELITPNASGKHDQCSPQSDL
ncbi:hypothetical protein MSG28_004309 [Choristoneura fumiferana]|uniref:Uncharacterized protein n=1 Tax=Choristoneura fumiferana TaxID=7141 RepID=A0ACC0KJI0_CHOFU|nr:hypothetical protein MSG28_004309 [Choristoneura fumiferana]